VSGPPLIVNLALTGMVPTRESSPHVPLTTEEILEDVRACAALGAAIVHVHARGPDGRPTHRAEAFAEIIEGIRAIDPELVVCATTSGRDVADVEARAEVLDLEGAARPDMASLTLGSNNFPGQVSANAPDTIKDLALRMRDRGIRPELEAFEPGMVAYGRHLLERGVLEEPCYLNVILGGQGTAPLTPAVLAGFLSLVPDAWTWALGGIGRAQIDTSAMAVAAGGHVRIGLEDNLWLDRDRRHLATNAEMVERVAELAQLSDRPLATPGQVRERLGLARVASPR
jgi:3-oxoadipate:acetyl-CoA acetyltransferase